MAEEEEEEEEEEGGGEKSKSKVGNLRVRQKVSFNLNPEMLNFAFYHYLTCKCMPCLVPWQLNTNPNQSR